LAQALEKGVDIKHITMSSDGNASLPTFDDKGKLIDLQVGQVKSLHQSMVDAVLQYKVPLNLALSSITQSPANILSLGQKGQLATGKDADLNILNKNSLQIEVVIAKGYIVVNNT